MTKRTKVVCTLGPASDSLETITQLMEIGMDVARLNCSHSTHEELERRIDRVKRARRDLGKPVAILLDVSGPCIRTGAMKDDAPVELHKGAYLTITDEPCEGTAERVSQNFAGLHEHVKPGTMILMDDGLIELEVERVEGHDVICKILNESVLHSHKKINVPGTPVPLPVMTEKDKSDLIFACEQKVDFVGASFVRTGDNIREIREFIRAHGGDDIRIIAKIENALALDDVDDIVYAADAVMVARGDLGVEVDPVLVPHLQKKIIKTCIKNYRPVITATQMLDSMIHNPRPTRAEVADVANAIYDGTDAVMLSGETTVGDYPLEACEMLVGIAEASEPYLFEESRVAYRDRKTEIARIGAEVGLAAVHAAEDLNATALVAPTLSGRTARFISSFRPQVPFYAMVGYAHAARYLNLCWGVTPILMGKTDDEASEVFAAARRELVDHGILKEGDIAVFTAGDPDTAPSIPSTILDHVPHATASTNSLLIAEIREQGMGLGRLD